MIGVVIHITTLIIILMEIRMYNAYIPKYQTYYSEYFLKSI